MPFLLLLLLTLVCLVDPWPEAALRLLPREQVGRNLALSFLLTGLVLVIQTGLAAALARWTADRLQLFPEDRDSTGKRHGRLRGYLLFALIGGYGLSLWAFGWGWAVQTAFATRAGTLPGAELLTLAPLLAGLMLSWACLYDADKAFHDTAPAVSRGEFFLSRRAYLGFQLRHNLAIVLVPLVLLVVEKGLSRYSPGIHEDRRYQIAAILGIATVFVSLPWLLRLLLGLRPLPDGPLRDRLLTASGRLGFRCSDILRWDTRGVTANALVAGLLPRPRYVILTDKLMAELTPDEVEAVFGHEIGHIRHRHMLYYLIFLLLSMAALIGLWEIAARALGPVATAVESLPVPIDQAVAANGLRMVPFVVLLGSYIFVVFGFLSRRCERQADLFGCRTVSCGRAECAGHYTDEESRPRGHGLCPAGIRTFISALEKVAYLNGISRDKPGWLQSWQHSTIARRVDFLQNVLVNPLLERRFQRTVLLVKCGLLLGLVCVAVGAWLYLLGAVPDRLLAGWLPV